MGLILYVAAGLVLWVVLWSLSATVDLTNTDAFLVALGVMLIGATVRIAGRYLPSRRR